MMVMPNNESSKRDALTHKMRNARGKKVVALQGYNVIRSTNPDIVIIALEGYDDPTCYKAIIRIIDPNFNWIPLVCKGKDIVLGLKDLLERNKSADDSKTYFIVDKDFDSLKGYKPSEKIYCTPCYSIENLLVTVKVFEELLLCEFKCSAASDEVTELKKLFNARLEEFFSAIAMANRALHYCRVNGVRSGSVENRINKYVNVSLDGVDAIYTESDLERLVGFPSGKDLSCLDETSEIFDKLDPMNDWRGKYIMCFFIELLNQLQEDRNSKHPKNFKKHQKISFNPRTNAIFRILGSMIDPPTCLRNFVSRIAA